MEKLLNRDKITYAQILKDPDLIEKFEFNEEELDNLRNKHLKNSKDISYLFEPKKPI